LGWEAKVLENDDLKVKKDGLKFHFGHLETKGKTAEWFHNGSHGKIVFPYDWLNNTPVHFQDFRIHAVKPEFQYVLKLHPEFMNPEWKHRDKDLIDIKVLSGLINRTDLKSVESKMKSFNL
jgi:hypothetical protein